MKAQKGFTLIEMMITVTIIGILAAVSVPSYQTYINKAHVSEPILYGGGIKDTITEYYGENLNFPQNNAQANLPPANKLISNKIEAVEVINGALHIRLGNKVPPVLQGKTLSFRPAVVTDSPRSPIAWLCGYSEPVSGMQAVGSNKTDIDLSLLPRECQQ